MRRLVLSLRSPTGYCALVLGFVPQRQPTLSLSGVKLFSARSGCLKLLLAQNEECRK